MPLPAVVTRSLRYAAVALTAGVVALIGARALEAWRAPPLSPWHTRVPVEPSAAGIDALDWAGWRAHEDALLDAVADEMAATMPTGAHREWNRYAVNSRDPRRHGAQDWNRSYVLTPDGAPRGAVVLLHGLTDSPYSLRHIARHYATRGFVAVGVRLPGHGTVPAGLTAADTDDWLAAARLAVREAERLAPGAPLHLVGYSTGATLALLATLDAIAEARPTAAQLVLISPLIGINRAARYVGVLGWPALVPAFARAAWIDVVPEYNPYKYNSFPVHAARESARIAERLDAALAAHAADGTLSRLPPTLAFQSIADATVSTRAVSERLYARLDADAHALVLFDIDRSPELATLTRAGAAPTPAMLLEAAPRGFSVCVLTNQGRGDRAIDERCTARAAVAESVRPTPLALPRDVYSLSHVALPMPLDDGLYGLEPSPDDPQPIHLGALAARGERGVLTVTAADQLRLKSNPLFPYLLARIDARIDVDGGDRSNAMGKTATRAAPAPAP